MRYVLNKKTLIVFAIFSVFFVSHNANAAISGVQINSSTISEGTLTVKWQFTSLPSIDYFGAYTLMPILNATSRTDTPSSGSPEALNNNNGYGSSYPNVTMRASDTGCNSGITPRSYYSTGVEYTDTFTQVWDQVSGSYRAVSAIDTGTDDINVLKWIVSGACNFGGVSSDSYETLSFPPPPPADNIQIDFPVNATSTSDFAVWIVKYSLAEATTTSPNIFILYDTSSSTVSSATSSILFPAFSDFRGVPTATTTDETYVIPKYNTLEIGETYYAKAFLENVIGCPVIGPCLYPNRELIASSTMLSFYVSGAGAMSSYFPTPTTTATSSEWTITCDPDDPLFQRSLCYVFKYLFAPSGTTLTLYAELRDDLSTKPPFGYFSAAKNAIEDINWNATSSAGMADLSAMDSNFFSPLRIVIKWVLWIVFIFWLFSVVRKIDL